MSQEFEQKLNELWGETFRDIGKRLTVYCNNADRHGGPDLDGVKMRRVDSTLSSKGGLDEPLFIYQYHCECGASTSIIIEGKGYKK